MRRQGALINTAVVDSTAAFDTAGSQVVADFLLLRFAFETCAGRGSRGSVALGVDTAETGDIGSGAHDEVSGEDGASVEVSLFALSGDEARLAHPTAPIRQKIEPAFFGAPWYVGCPLPSRLGVCMSLSLPLPLVLPLAAVDNSSSSSRIRD